MSTTCQCGKPTGSTASLCRDCRQTLEYAIAHVGIYHDDLRTLRTRQVRYGTGNGSRAAETPDPIDARFDRAGVGTEVEDVTRSTVVAWTRIVLDHVSVGHGPTCTRPCPHASCGSIAHSRPPRDTIGSMCAYLMRHADWLRVSPFGPEILDEMTHVEALLRRVIDRPADRWFAGRCGHITAVDGVIVTCEERLYATVGKPTVTCPVCTSEYDVSTRRTTLLAAAENEIATTTDLARAITNLSDGQHDEGRLAQRIRQWATRNRILPRTHRMVDGRMRPLYRVGDVLDLLAQDARRAEEKRGSRVAKVVAC